MKKKTIDDFTPEIQAKIPAYIKKYTEGIFDGGKYRSFKKENAEALINFNYEKCGHKKPVIIVAENPFEAQIFFNYMLANKDAFLLPLYVNYCLLNGMELPEGLKIKPELHSQLYSQLDSQLGSQLDSQLGSQLYSQLDSQLGSQLYSQLYSQLGSQLYSQLYSQLDSQLRSQLYSQLDSQLRSQLDSQLGELGKFNDHYLFTVSTYGGAYFAWYKFIKDEFNIDAPINVDLDSFNSVYENSGVYSAVFSELVCVVSKHAKQIHRNENNDLHSVNGSAIEWGSSTDLTKWNCFYINGRNVPEKYFNSISDKTYKMEDFINEGNEEYKSTCIALMQEKYGDEYLVDFFREHLKEVDTFVDKKKDKYLEGTTKGMNVGVYTLFKGMINDEKIAYVRCYCPSTDRMFFLGVDSVHNTAKDAIASLYRIPTKLKSHIKSISRQGERYSTILTDKGKEVLSSLTEKEIGTVSGIDGDSYFKLIQYEF